jgi:hypothetical protein
MLVSPCWPFAYVESGGRSIETYLGFSLERRYGGLSHQHVILELFCI